MILVFLILPEANIERKIGAFATMIAEISHLSKLQFIYLNLERIEAMLKILRDLYDEQKKDKTVDHQYLLSNSGVIYKYLRTNVVLASIFMSLPIITSLFIYLKNQEWVPSYPLDCWFPFDQNSYYVPVYMYSLYIGLIYGVILIAGDALFNMILTHITQQLKELYKNFSNLLN